MKSKLYPVAITLLLASFLYLTAVTGRAEESAADLHKKGIEALKDSQTNPTAIVTAARCFAKASALYESSGKTDLAVEMNSYLYWCKKKMSLADIDAFLKDEGTTVSARLKAVENKSPVPSEAQAWLERADAFAKANPSEHLLAAVRFFEVADRFKDTDAGRAAMSKSLAEMQQVVTQKGKPVKPVEETLVKPVDLLKRIDLARDTVEGKWTFNGEILVAEKAKHARLEIPFTLPSEYDFKIVFMRSEGLECIGQILQCEGRQFLWGIDGDKGSATGFERIGETSFRENYTTFKGSLVKNGQWHTSVVRVRKDRVTALIDGKQIAEVKSPDYEKMCLHPVWKLRDIKMIGLCHSDCTVGFKTIELIPVADVDPKAQRSGEQAKLEAYRPMPTDGKVFVKSEPPGAAILLVAADGRKLDTGKLTPALVQIPVGNQTLELSLKTYKPAPLRIDVDGVSIGKSDVIKLNPITVPVGILFDEGWRVFVDGSAARPSKSGTADTPCTVELPLGNHEIALAKMGFLDIRQRVEIVDAGIKRPGQSPTAAFEINARPSKGTSTLLIRNLIPLIDPARDSIAGKWQLQDGKLLSDKTVRAILQIPYHPPEEYDLIVEFTQVKKARHIFLILSGSNVQFVYQMGHDNSAGFEMISGKRSSKSEATKPFAFDADKKYRATIKVRKDRVSAYVDDKLISELTTDFHDLSISPTWAIRDRRAIAVTADETFNVYSSITVTEISGPGEVVREKP